MGAEEAELATTLRALRLELSAAIGAVESRKTCAIGHPPPHGHYPGGHCCGLKTEDAFNDDELAALRQAGTTVADLRPHAQKRSRRLLIPRPAGLFAVDPRSPQPSAALSVPRFAARGQPPR